MSIVAFTFGSLGDIVTLLQIANDVRKELCNIPGTAIEYHELVVELDSVVFTVSIVLNTLSIQGPSRFEQSVENAIYHAVGASLRLLQEMNQRIFTWRHRGSTSVGTMMVTVWQRVGWTLFSKRELLDYRARLSSQVLAMNTLLSLAQRSDLDRVGSQVTRICEESVEPIALIREIYRCVKNPPRRMGYTWEGEPDYSSLPIVFTDILGHTVTLPWELLSTRQRLHEFLLFYFRDRPDREFIYHGTYRTLVQQNDTYTTPYHFPFRGKDHLEDQDSTNQAPKPGCRLEIYATVDKWMPRHRLTDSPSRGEPLRFPVMMALHVEGRKPRAKNPLIGRLLPPVLSNLPVNRASGWLMPAPNNQGVIDFAWWHYVPIPSSWVKLRCIDEYHPAFDKKANTSDYTTYIRLGPLRNTTVSARFVPIVGKAISPPFESVPTPTFTFST